ncbi:reverse transcriptase domain-containing protein [Artemisia annua]|uniref:Reverse transcriptase domain-containing protein n=1 Tax=Artemisia annua TaxID=35608 RepID=A0A2U1PH32_ARTAN|nr:reverse transcriptase domain-containing protein [Artemisia annua]
MQIEGALCFKWKAQVSGFDRQQATLGITDPENSTIPTTDTSAELHDDPPAERAPVEEDIPESSRMKDDLTSGPRAWRLYTDGALNDNGSRVGLILITPDNVEYSYALRPNFSNSNSATEYEALLAGLKIATEM